MSVSGIEEFAESLATNGRPADERRPMSISKVAILGGGDDARMLASLSLAAGMQTTLFSAYGAELSALRQAGGITIRGAGPIGTYQIDQDGIPSIKTTAELDSAVADADVLFLTGPVHKQRTYAMVLADHVRDGQVLVIAPGRTLGAAEVAWLLRVGGRRADVIIVEAQALPYWTRAQGGTLHLSQTRPCAAATLPAGRADVVAGLQPIMPNIVPVASIVHSSFADGSGLVEVPALLLGGPVMGDGMPELPEGGQPLDANRNFRTLIGAQHRAVMASIAKERQHVAQAFGIRDLPTLDEWLDTHAGSAKGENTRAVPSQAEAASIVRCATIGSHVPLASAGRMAGRATPATDAMITLASTVLDADIASAGRRLETTGITADTIEDARRIIDAIAKGTQDG